MSARAFAVKGVESHGARIAPPTDGIGSFTGPALQFGVAADVRVVDPLSVTAEVFGVAPRRVGQRSRSQRDRCRAAFG